MNRITAKPKYPFYSLPKELFSFFSGEKKSIQLAFNGFDKCDFLHCSPYAARQISLPLFMQAI